MPLMNLVSAGGIPKATVTATTGSPNIDSSTRAGKTIYNFTGSGSITVGTAGTCEVLVIGGGGGAGVGGGGGGGLVYSITSFLAAGTQTVTVGSGGGGGVGNGGQVAGYPGASSGIGRPSTNGSTWQGIVAIGGGGGGSNFSGASGQNGGSGGGGASSGGTGQLSQGNNGSASYSSAGGGGGAGGASTNANGGVGLSVNITGTGVTYSVGGTMQNNYSPVNGGANTGNGGWHSLGDGGAGGSGRVIVVIG